MTQNPADAQGAALAAPAFDDSEVAVVFVLGGPGAGKGTQCARIARDFGFRHLSAGDALREEQGRPGSNLGNLIREYIITGKIVPSHITVSLLKAKMVEARTKDGATRFLIDGFPRKSDQATVFEADVCRARFILFFDCPLDVLEKRLLERGKTSGRSDDNVDSVRRRFVTFTETSMPVVDSFVAEGRVVKIDAKLDPDTIYRDVRAALEDKGFRGSEQSG